MYEVTVHIPCNEELKVLLHKIPCHVVIQAFFSKATIIRGVFWILTRSKLQLVTARVVLMMLYQKSDNSEEIMNMDMEYEQRKTFRKGLLDL